MFNFLFCKWPEAQEVSDSWAAMKISSCEDSVKNGSVGLTIVHQWRFDAESLWYFGP